MPFTSVNPNKTNSPRSLMYLKIVQFIFWIIGIALLGIMIFIPPLGVTLFWNILIPVAPALLVVATGVWRNICPLATTALLPDRLGLSGKKKLSISQSAVLNLFALALLFIIVPLRHVVFNTSGQATAFIIIVLSTIAVALGFVFERKSGWCSGVCPVHPVEKLYGSGVAFSLPNAHCSTCVKCVMPCPDSIANGNPLSAKKSTITTINEHLLVGAFPGYIWGWFQVADYTGNEGWQHLQPVYGYPFMGATVTFTVYFFVKQFLKKENERLLVLVFAATAVCCYYWFRLPQLLGLTSTDTNGALIDLSKNLPAWTIWLLRIASTSFFVWWILIRTKTKKSWSVRPEYADKKRRVA